MIPNWIHEGIKYNNGNKYFCIVRQYFSRLSFAVMLNCFKYQELTTLKNTYKLLL